MNKSSLIGKNPFNPMDREVGMNKWQWYEQGKYDVLFTLNDYYIKTGKGLKELDKFIKWAKKQGGFSFDKKKFKQKQELMDLVDKTLKGGKYEKK
jgi:hypothetical protein